MLRPYRLLPAVLASVVLVATSACASGGYYGSPRYPGGARPNVRQVDDRAYRYGFEDGRRIGEEDARRGRAFDYQRHGEYRSANAGYNGYGNRNAYHQVFREGFVAGYNDGYRRYARGGYGYPSAGPNIYNGPGGTAVYRSGSPAAQTGYRDGLDQGQRDARSNHQFDPVRAERYRDGDHDYNSRYGSRDEYKREYRAAFQEGYQQGYRGVRR